MVICSESLDLVCGANELGPRNRPNTCACRYGRALLLLFCVYLPVLYTVTVYRNSVIVYSIVVLIELTLGREVV